MVNSSTFTAILTGAVLASALGATPAFAANYAVPDPSSGVLIDTTGLYISETPDVFYVGSGRDGDHALGGNRGCEINAKSDHVFGTQSILVSVEGEYTFRVVETSTNQTNFYPEVWNSFEYFGAGRDLHPIEDSFIAIYEGGFDKDNPDSRVIGCNDDSDEIWAVLNANDGGTDPDWVDYAGDTGTWVYGTDNVTINGDPVSGQMPQFTAHLEPGEYTILLTTWNEMPLDWWTNSTAPDSDWDWAGGDASVTTEIWGPAEGVTLPKGNWEILSNDYTSEGLAPTGGSDAIVGSLVLGSAVVACGFVIRRRRRA